jgi:monothiol glutaredoxin
MLVALSLLLDTVNNTACNGNELWKNIPLLFSCLSSGGAWYTQRSAVGEYTDSHDDFRPVRRESVSVPSVYELIEQDIQENPVMVYMKGVPGAPQCGLSSMVCKVLDSYEVKYKSRDVLADQELREGIKSFSNWPTIPQVYVDGEFLGGSDILMSMHRVRLSLHILFCYILDLH